MEIKTLRNFNVYLDGTLSFLGKASELTLPALVAATEDYAAAGMIGVLQLPGAKLDAMTARVLWAGYYEEALELGADPFMPRKLQVRGSIERHSDTGLLDEVPVLVHLGARFLGTPLGALVAQTATTLEQNMAVHYVKVVVGGVERVEIDVHNQIWKVAGVDLMAKRRTNLGL